MQTNTADRSVNDLDRLCVDTIRFLSVDAVQKANSGHPGLPMGAAPMAYVLWKRHLRHDPADPDWFDRDRFVLSAGHGSMLLYSLLYLTGYPLSLDDIKQFRQYGSATPGHPERERTKGVEVTTGPLGQGFGNGVGLAVAEAHLAALFNRDGYPVIDHFTYGLVSDGDLMEGVASEAASLAGHLRLGKLIYLYDDNRISLASSTGLEFTENVGERFHAYGWHVQRVEDGNDLQAIDGAIRAARAEIERPSLVIVRTHIGYGSPHKQDTFEAHGAPLGSDEVKATKLNLGWPLEPDFYVPQQSLDHFRKAVRTGMDLKQDWEVRMDAYEAAFPREAAELRRLIAGRLPDGWADALPSFPADAKGTATRSASGKVLTALAGKLPAMIGGAADLDPSTKTALAGQGDLESPDHVPADRQGAAGGAWGYAGRNIHFGVREHAMGAVLNGMAAHGGTIPYGGTFLIFSDYMRPPMRLASLMGIRVIFVFTHDSIGLGEDGPTHQPVEQLANLRAVPGLTVIRPADANETATAWQVAIERNGRPTALILTRQDVPVLDRSRYAPADGLRRGAYVLWPAPAAREVAAAPRPAGSPAGQAEPDLILIASGSEVSLITGAAEELVKQGVRVRLVSMPSWELFEAQTPEYRESVLPYTVTARLAVEAGSPQGWHRYVGDQGDVIGVEKFGCSAPGPIVMREYGFTVDNVCRRALALADGKRRGPRQG